MKSLVSSLPYQYDNYRSDTIEKNDNQKLDEKDYGEARIEQPKMNLHIRDSEGDIQEIKLISQDGLENAGDTATFKLKGFRTSGNIIDVMAQIDQMYREKGLNDLIEDE